MKRFTARRWRKEGEAIVITILGDFSAELDEGYKNTSHYLANQLEHQHTIVRLNYKEVRGRAFWGRVRSCSPDVIHTVAQPTDQSLLFTALLRQRWRKASAVVSALRADRYFPTDTIKPKQRALLRMADPNLVLVQSKRDEDLFKRAGCCVQFLSNGVDLDRFSPVTNERKRELRLKYDLDPERPVVLHVGHLEPARNLLSLEGVASAGIQVLIAGSLYMGVQHDYIERLERAGFCLLKGYQPMVEELYQLSDLYVFPLQPGNSISMPLSVLEAMACNLPILTTRFAGLEHAFAEEPGFSFIDDRNVLVQSVQESLESRAVPATREMVRRFSWPAIARQLEVYYSEIVAA